MPRVIRNPEARCGNCPFWDTENVRIQELPTNLDGTPRGKDDPVVKVRSAQCRADPATPLVIVKMVAPPGSAILMGKARVAPEPKQVVEWTLFTPMDSHWCARHPFILMQVEDDKAN